MADNRSAAAKSARDAGRGGGQARRHDPPAFLPDFTEEQRVAWDELVGSFFSSSLDMMRKDVSDQHLDPDKLVPQYFDPTAYDGDLVVQPVTWNAFPKELLVRFGRRRALVEADRLWPLAAYFVDSFSDRYYDSESPGTFVPNLNLPFPVDFMLRSMYRPTVEYCEWHVNRDPLTGKIVKVTFTSEPPEYWIAMWGGPSPGGGPTFPDGRRQVLELYRELVSRQVEIEDLISPYDVPYFGVVRGGYNPYNKWNTTHGIVHLCAPPNSLAAEVQLGAEATLRRIDGAGNPVTDPQILVCCAGYGGVNRNSDPTIGATVNALARMGAMLTLPNPVGLYMDHIDLSGWLTPDRSPPVEWVTIVRGSPGMIERLVVAPPSGSSATVSDLTIGGEPVVHGGQLAECITVKLNGGAYGIGSVPNNLMLSCSYRCCASVENGLELGILKLQDPLPIGTVAAATPAGGAPPVGAMAAHFAARELAVRHRNSARSRVPALRGA
jgi:hypothetical protein